MGCEGSAVQICPSRPILLSQPTVDTGTGLDLPIHEAPQSSSGEAGALEKLARGVAQQRSAYSNLRVPTILLERQPPSAVGSSAARQRSHTRPSFFSDHPISSRRTCFSLRRVAHPLNIMKWGAPVLSRFLRKGGNDELGDGGTDWTFTLPRWRSIATESSKPGDSLAHQLRKHPLALWPIRWYKRKTVESRDCLL